MKKTICLFLILLNYLSFSQKNLISNGGFENDLDSWNGDVAKLNHFDKKNGSNSAIITQFTGAEWKGIDQTISIPKNTIAIEFSGWVKSDAIEQGKKEWNTGKFDIEFINASGKGFQYETVATLVGSTKWTFYKKIVRIPSSANKFKIMLALNQTNGTILFDDIKATIVSQEELNKIQEAENALRMPVVISGNYENKPIVFSNGSFENGMTSWRGYATISSTEFKEGTAAMMLNSKTFEWTGIDQIADVPENATSIIISGWLKSDAITQGKDVWNNGLLNVEFTGIDAAKVSDDQSVTFVTGTTDWTFYSKKIQLPKGAKKYRIMLALGFSTGTLFADDINVKFE